MRELGQARGTADCVEGLAAVAREAESTALLVGAAEALREAAGAPRPADQQAWFERKLGEARARMGEEAFDAGRARGRALGVDGVLALAQA